MGCGAFILLLTVLLSLLCRSGERLWSPALVSIRPDTEIPTSFHSRDKFFKLTRFKRSKKIDQSINRSINQKLFPPLLPSARSTSAPFPSLLLFGRKSIGFPLTTYPLFTLICCRWDRKKSKTLSTSASGRRLGRVSATGASPFRSPASAIPSMPRRSASSPNRLPHPATEWRR